MLWSGTTHSVLGAPVNSTCYIKKKKDCELRHKAVWQKTPTKCCKATLNIPIKKMRYINTIP